ncbi:oligosaccharide flippase family protein [Streptacidiphilus monticola]
MNTVVIRIGNFAAGVVLARTMLGPAEWGLYALAVTVLGVLLSFNELGVTLAVIRWDHRPLRQFVPTAVTVSVLFSCVLYAALYLSAPQLAHLLGSADAVPVLRVLCVSVLIDGFACVPHSVMAREFAQGKRLLLDLLNFLVTTGVTLGMADSGHGALSFAWGAFAGNLTALAGCAVYVPWAVRPGWDRSTARELVRFGLPLAGTSLLVIGMINVDTFVVGATLGPAALGLYQIAFNVSSWPVRSISEAARRVSFAGFSRLADDTRQLAHGFRRGLALLMAAAVPPCALLGVLAKPVIVTVYGDAWAAAAAALSFLAVLGLLRVGYELAYDCLAAAARQRDLLAVQGWWLAALIPVLIVAAHWRGIQGVGIGHVLVASVLVAPAFAWALQRAGIPARLLLQACGRPSPEAC